MVRGQSIFQEWFKDFENQYVLIGGTAASITMNEAGVQFRATKDLDIVLHVEILTKVLPVPFPETAGRRVSVHAGAVFTSAGRLELCPTRSSDAHSNGRAGLQSVGHLAR